MPVHTPDKSLPWILVIADHFQCVVVVNEYETIVDSGNMLYSYVNKRLDVLIKYASFANWSLKVLCPFEKVNLTPLSIFQWESDLVKRGLIYKLVDNRLVLQPK